MSRQKLNGRIRFRGAPACALFATVRGFADGILRSNTLCDAVIRKIDSSRMAFQRENAALLEQLSQPLNLRSAVLTRRISYQRDFLESDWKPSGSAAGGKTEPVRYIRDLRRDCGKRVNAENSIAAEQEELAAIEEKLLTLRETAFQREAKAKAKEDILINSYLSGVAVFHRKYNPELPEITYSCVEQSLNRHSEGDSRRRGAVCSSERSEQE